MAKYHVNGNMLGCAACTRKVTNQILQTIDLSLDLHKHSQPSFVTSGVPQGTVLGPLLFLLYVNDLPDNLKSSVRLFADDALLYGVMTNEEDGDQLQEDLQQLEVWQCKWQMVFNPTKCKTICISTKKTPPQRKYTFCGVELEQVNSFFLSWSNHN